ncbi:hypothetical protein ACQVP2_34010 [Methylobacterium aquaticum]|jgi:hypothetical protein|uniref:hypothetical protein n=1 Tax=Methylobacterium aquaticum TaxID=270351 RepID=UPI003D181D54
MGSPLAPEMRELSSLDADQRLMIAPPPLSGCALVMTLAIGSADFCVTAAV